MYKSELQEICQKNRWAMPEYTSVKFGLPHEPRFTATVTVQGVTFGTPEDQRRSSKEAQNSAARLAVNHFTGLQSILQPQIQSQTPFASHSGSSSRRTHLGGDGQKPKEVLDLYKNKLQNYAQKHTLNFPTYSCEYDGPPHALKFKAKVTFCGKIYESPEFFSTKKEAEVAAAKVAFDALPCDDTEEDQGQYKNLLQELAQKEGIILPSYVTKKTGPPHMPTFIATVEIGSEVFQGQEAHTKKKAESRAAKVSYNDIIKRRKLNEHVVISSSSEKLIDPSELFQNIQPNAELIANKEMNVDVQDAKIYRCAPSLEEVSAHCDTTDPSIELNCPKNVFVLPEYQNPNVEDNPYMQILDGASVMPISDDKWVDVTEDLNKGK